MAVTSINSSFNLHKSLADARSSMSDLQRQLATQKKTTSYGGLGADRTHVLSFRGELSQLEGYRRTSTIVNTRLEVTQLALSTIREDVEATGIDVLSGEYTFGATGQTDLQTFAKSRFLNITSLLNTSVGDRYVFGGRVTESQPVVNGETILDGDGTRAGFRQVSSERRQADLGADGLGRLEFTGPEATVTGSVIGTPLDIGGALAAVVTIDIGGDAQNFDISDGGFDDLVALEAAIDAAFGADVASIGGPGNDQLLITATNGLDAITITDVDIGAAALAGLVAGGGPTNPTATIILAEDDAANVFGFKISAVTSNLTGTTVTGPAGSPTDIDVAFSATLPVEGDTISYTLDLPDGSEKSITLTAVAELTGEPGEFLIGADENETAVNFQTGLTASVTAAAATELRSASLFVAADNFFDVTATNTLQRVDGPPFDTATALVNATAADTVFYYQGEISTSSARGSAVAKVDDSLAVAHGVRANEDAFRTVLKNFAVLAVETFDASDANGSDRYDIIRNQVASDLRFDNGQQSVKNIEIDIAVAQLSVVGASERHGANKVLLEALVFDVENADIYEVSAQILDLQTRIEATLAVTATLSQLSILKFL